MAQWEYCRILFTTRIIDELEQQTFDERAFTGRIDKEVLLGGAQGMVARVGSLWFIGQPDETIQTVTDLGSTIAGLGYDGWEMVSHAMAGISTDMLFFKRQIDDGAGEAKP